MGAMAGAAVGGAVVGGVIGANHGAIGGAIADGANAVAGWAPGAMDTAGGWVQAGYYGSTHPHPPQHGLTPLPPPPPPITTRHFVLRAAS